MERAFALRALALRAFALLFLSFVVIGVVEAKQNVSFPTSPVTTIRMDTYQDGFNTTGLSTWTIDTSTWVDTGLWVVPGSSMTMIDAGQKVYFSSYSFSNGVWSVVPSSISLQDYTQKVVDLTKLNVINEIMDKDMEQFLVWPDTNPVAGWQGFCGQVAPNGTLIAVFCP